MKVLIICGTENNTRIITPIVEALKSYIEEDKRRAKNSTSNDEYRNINEIKSKQNYDDFLFEQNKPDFVFIQTELTWGRKNQNVSGYEIALDLILHKLKSHFFNIQFISLDDRKVLAAEVDGKYRKLVQTFHHLTFPFKSDAISFKKNNYSELHFELIKSLVIDDENRINVIEHDVDTIKSNFELSIENFDVNAFKISLRNQVEELSILKFIASEKVDRLKKEIEKSTIKDSIKSNISELEDIIDDAKRQLSNSSNEEFNSSEKINYKVLIVEDEREWRSFFSHTFSEIYQTVFPGDIKEIDSFEISNSKEIIKAKKDYNIFVLDLLYKDKNGFWLPFNGLDLYLFVKEQNPYSCIRIITSLPRDIVSKISGLLLKTDIKISHVFTKKVGYERLKYGIYDRVLEMNIECRENEKRKTVFKPIPKHGIFNWDGVSDIVFYLMTKENETYLECWQKAFAFFDMFQAGTLSQSSLNWKGGELPTPKKKDNFTDSYILERLPIIFTHRLLIISEALEHSDNVIDTDNFECTVLKSICNIKIFSKGYIHKLGFSTTPFDNFDDNISGFRIEFENLFPEEILFIADIKKRQTKIPNEDDILTNYPLLALWFNSVLMDLEIYENWDELELDFCPYKAIGEIDNSGRILESNIDNSISILQLEKYLRSLIKGSYDILIQKAINQTLDYYSIRDENKVPKHILSLIKELFKIETVI